MPDTSLITKISVILDRLPAITETTALKEKVRLSFTENKLTALISLLMSPDELSHNLAKCLSDTWELTKGTMCAPTAIPGADITEVFLDVAISLSEDPKASSSPKSPLEFLMPGVNLEPCDSASYPDLKEVCDLAGLKTILQTHILSESGKYLVPVALLATEKEQGEAYYRNPYWDTEDENFAIGQSELTRLYEHNTASMELKEAQERHEVACKGSMDMYEQLMQLVAILNLHRAYGGLGTETHAGEGVYQGIIAFNDYYQALIDTTKDQIPQRLRDIIESKLDLCSDSKKKPQCYRGNEHLHC